jgi:hypothetical protein
MNLPRLEADQLYTWSDIHAPKVAQPALFPLAPPPQAARASVAAPSSPVARLAHRSLQSLRQARMQVCPRPWSRPQVLSLCELLRSAPADGLRAPGLALPDHRLRRQLLPDPRDLGGDLRDQPRTAAPPRGALSDGDARGTFFALYFARHGILRRTSGEYAQRLAGKGTRPFEGNTR